MVFVGRQECREAGMWAGEIAGEIAGMWAGEKESGSQGSNPEQLRSAGPRGRGREW